MAMPKRMMAARIIFLPSVPGSEQPVLPPRNGPRQAALGQLPVTLAITGNGAAAWIPVLSFPALNGRACRETRHPRERCRGSPLPFPAIDFPAAIQGLFVLLQSLDLGFSLRLCLLILRRNAVSMCVAEGQLARWRSMDRISTIAEFVRQIM